MHMVKKSGHPADHLSTRSVVLSVDSSTGTSFLGPVARWYGEVSSLRGDALVVGLLLISLFVAALLIPFERLIPQEQNGSKSSHSTNTGSHQKKNSGGTAKEQYEEK